MKLYLLALSLLAGTSTFAQQPAPGPLTLPVDAKTHQITYSGIVAVPGATKNELYARGKIWFVTPSYLRQRVLMDDDQQAEFIVAKVFSYTNMAYVFKPNSKKFWCTIKLAFQNGKYRYTLTDFLFDNAQPGPLIATSEIGESGPRLGTSEVIQAGSLNEPRYSAEQMCLAKSKDGTLTTQAGQFSQDFDQQVQRLVAGIEAGMATGGSAR